LRSINRKVTDSTIDVAGQGCTIPELVNDIGNTMIALLLIPIALAFAFGVSSIVESQVEEEAERIAENNGLGDFDEDAPSIFDNGALESAAARGLTGLSARPAMMC